jgi:hypothetical protein
MSDKRICKYCGMELSEDVPHGLRECNLHAVNRIAELEAVIEILEDQQREAKNILIDKNLHIDSLYEEGYKLQKRIAELESAQRWRVVADGELPEFGTSILFYDSILEKINKGTCTALDRDKTNLQWITDDGLYYHGNRCEYITHWMPLPELPIVYGKEREE